NRVGPDSVGDLLLGLLLVAAALGVLLAALVLLALLGGLRLLALLGSPALAGGLDLLPAVRPAAFVDDEAEDAFDRLRAEVGRVLQQAVLATRQDEDEFAHRQVGDAGEGGA